MFGIVIPARNAERTLDRALLSLLKQTYKSWRCVIVDDGSEDGTFEVAGEWVLADHRFSRIRLSPQLSGPGPARNAGANHLAGFHASVQYLAMLDSDDEFMPEHLAKRKELLEQYPYLHLIYGQQQIIGSPFVVDKNDASKLIPIRHCSQGASLVIRADVFEILGGYVDAYGEDGILLDAAIAAGLQIFRSFEETYRYIRRPGSITDSALVAMNTPSRVNPIPMPA